MQQTKNVKGLGASTGFAVGSVHYYNANESLSKEPTILVVKELSRNVVVSLQQNVCAVIAEKGSVGCHGAGILREKGIPCIIRIPNISEILYEGDVVEVNGENGTLHILEQLSYKNLKWESTIRVEKKEISYRPNRIYQKLRFDILKNGWEESPNYLFGLPKCELKLKNGVVFISNAPNLYDLRNAIIENPDETLMILKKRSLTIQRIKIELKDIQGHLNYNDIFLVYSQFKKCVELYKDLLKYIYITQFVSDDLTDELVTLIDRCEPGSESREKYIEERLKSDYVSVSVQEKVDPGVSTTWTIPCREPYIWEGEINWKRQIGEYRLTEKVFERTEEEGFKFFVKYSSLMLMVPILYQLAEEHYFISSSICSFLNKFIEILANILVVDRELETEEEILQKSLEYVLTKFEERIGI